MYSSNYGNASAAPGGGGYYSSGPPGPGGGGGGSNANNSGNAQSGSSNNSHHPHHHHSHRRHPTAGGPVSSSIQNTIMSMNAIKSNFASNNLRTAELQKEKKAAAASRRQEQQLREAAKAELFEAGPGLFDCPQKVHADPQSQIVNQVLGRFEKAVINTPSCIGIDYQPQTPAPVQHVIDDEDEDPKPRRPPTLTRPNGSRLPENISQTHRPAARNSSSGLAQPPVSSSRGSSAMLPPPAPPRVSKNNMPNNAFLPPQVPSGAQGQFAGPLKKPGDSNKTRPKHPSSSSSFRSEFEESKKVREMIRQMKDPISGHSNQMPALLPAIVTPSITEHEGNNSRSVPKYFPTPSLPIPIGKLSASPPLIHGASKSSLSEDSDSDKEEAPRSVAQQQVSSPPPPQPLAVATSKSSPPPKASHSDSNSTAESSSEDSSESEDDDDGVCEGEDVKGGNGTAQEDSNEDEDEFSLANLAKKANLSKFSPSSTSAIVSSFKENSPEKKALAGSHLDSNIPPPAPLPVPSSHAEKSPPDDVDIDFISGLLTTSTPDINLDFAGSSNLPIDRPISPMKQSPEHEDEPSPQPPPPPPPPPPKASSKEHSTSRSSSRRRSASSSANSVVLDSSDEESVLKSSTTTAKRAPRTKKSRAKKDEAHSRSSSCSSSSKRTKSHRKASKRSLSSEDEDESFMKDQFSETHHLPEEPLEQSSGVGEGVGVEDTSPPPIAASNKKKNMALGNIFGVKTSSSKGGGKGKAGIKVEVIERQSNENPPHQSSGGGGGLGLSLNSSTSIHQHQSSSMKEKTIKSSPLELSGPRPRLLCRIPLRLLNHPFPPLSRRHHNHSRTTNASGGSIENLYSRRNLFDDEEELKVEKTVPSEKGGSKRRMKTTSSSSSVSSSGDSSKRLKLETGGEIPSGRLLREDSASSINSSNKMSEYLVEQNNKCMMPPPSKRSSSSSYLLESKDEEEDNEEEHNFCMSEAKRLKDEADKERDREQQAMKYIQAVLYFILCGNITERSGDKNIALVMYNETLSFIRDVCRPFKNSEFGNFDNKLAALSLRCQSLLYLKMYKLTQNEYRECQKIIGEHIMKASQQNSPNSNTPSPAGSDGSRSSGYTSSGEINNMGGRYSGVTTPPTSSLGGPSSSLGGPSSSSSHLPPPQCLTVPQNIMKKHFQYGTYLTQCHDLWEQADMYLHRGHCEEFIKRLDRMCGTLTLHSALKDLVKYIRTGLNFWSKEREEAALAAPGHPPPPSTS